MERRGRGITAEPVKNAVKAEIGARSEETSQIFISADIHTFETEAVIEIKPEETKITSEKETESVVSSEPVSKTASTQPLAASVQPRMGDVRVVNGKKQIYIDGFSWIVDEGGGSHRTMAGNPGDALTGNKVNIMGGEESVSCETISPPPANLPPKPTGDVIYIELQPTPTKDSIPPPYKPKHNATESVTNIKGA